jgi:hypothetical protein
MTGTYYYSIIRRLSLVAFYRGVIGLLGCGTSLLSKGAYLLPTKRRRGEEEEESDLVRGECYRECGNGWEVSHCRLLHVFSKARYAVLLYYLDLKRSSVVTQAEK